MSTMLSDKTMFRYVSYILSLCLHNRRNKMCDEASSIPYDANSVLATRLRYPAHWLLFFFKPYRRATQGFVRAEPRFERHELQRNREVNQIEVHVVQAHIGKWPLMRRKKSEKKMKFIKAALSRQYWQPLALCKWTAMSVRRNNKEWDGETLQKMIWSFLACIDEKRSHVVV